MKCNMCGKEKLLFETSTGVCADCYDKYFNLWRKNDQLEEKAQNLEMSLNEAKDTADAFYKELKVYKRALELACERLSREDVFEKQTKQDYYINQAKKELGEQK